MTAPKHFTKDHDAAIHSLRITENARWRLGDHFWRWAGWRSSQKKPRAGARGSSQNPRICHKPKMYCKPARLAGLQFPYRRTNAVTFWARRTTSSTACRSKAGFLIFSQCPPPRPVGRAQALADDTFEARGAGMPEHHVAPSTVSLNLRSSSVLDSKAASRTRRTSIGCLRKPTR
jgi:hypothetical protein